MMQRVWMLCLNEASEVQDGGIVGDLVVYVDYLSVNV